LFSRPGADVRVPIFNFKSLKGEAMLTLREKHEYEQEIADLKAELKAAKVKLDKLRVQRGNGKYYKKSIKS